MLNFIWQYFITTIEGKCSACDKTIEESAVLAGGETFHQDCFTCSHCQVGWQIVVRALSLICRFTQTMIENDNKGRLGERFYVVEGMNYCEEHQTAALDLCSA